MERERERDGPTCWLLRSACWPRPGSLCSTPGGRQGRGTPPSGRTARPRTRGSRRTWCRLQGSRARHIQHRNWRYPPRSSESHLDWRSPRTWLSADLQSLPDRNPDLGQDSICCINQLTRRSSILILIRGFIYFILICFIIRKKERKRQRTHKTNFSFPSCSLRFRWNICNGSPVSQYYLLLRHKWDLWDSRSCRRPGRRPRSRPCAGLCPGCLSPLSESPARVG